MKAIGLFIISILFISDTADNYLMTYEKKIYKEINKLFEGEISVEEVKQLTFMELGDDNSFYNLRSDETTIGYVNINKVNACSVGGCSNPGLIRTNRYDHFYYMAVFDSEFSILKLTVLDYQSEYGYEICSKNWLKQFQGSYDRNFEYDENIDAISGATVSGQAMVDEINILNMEIQNRFTERKQ